ncbi:hypothetical protein [Saccharopolyspora griseoalba]|uniref:DUF2637 domain-containing protein n=1 Tax=Saccharopolyspora griseoalba TaxID=1431848 RepID=A0ABW2LVG4_9PSEU
MTASLKRGADADALAPGRGPGCSTEVVVPLPQQGKATPTELPGPAAGLAPQAENPGPVEVTLDDQDTEVAAPAAADVEPEPRLRDVFLSRIRKRMLRKLDTGEAEVKEPPEKPILWIIGFLAVSAVTAAFVVSYFFLHLVAEGMGIPGGVSYIFALFPDLMALAAAAMLVFRTERALGWGLLVSFTGVSVAGNLAGHAIQVARGTTPFMLPKGWEWVGDLMAVAIPTGMALVLHVFLKKLADFLAFKKAEKKRNEAEKFEAKQQQEAAERKRKQEEAQAAQEAARRKEAQDRLPQAPTPGATPTGQVAVQFAIAYGIPNCDMSVTEMAHALGDKLSGKGWDSGGFSSRKKWIKQATDEIVAVAA